MSLAGRRSRTALLRRGGWQGSWARPGWAGLPSLARRCAIRPRQRQRGPCDSHLVPDSHPHSPAHPPAAVANRQPWQILISQVIMAQLKAPKLKECAGLQPKLLAKLCRWGGRGTGRGSQGDCAGAGAAARPFAVVLAGRAPLRLASISDHDLPHPAGVAARLTRLRPHTLHLPPPPQPAPPAPAPAPCSGALNLATDVAKSGKEGAELARMYLGMGKYGVPMNPDAGDGYQAERAKVCGRLWCRR